MKKQPRSLLALAIFCSVMLQGRDSQALDRQVPGQYPTINAAIAIANDGDRILVSPGTYQEFVDYEGKSLEIIGVDGPEFTFLDGAGSFLSVVKMESISTSCRLSGFTVQNGFGVSCGEPLSLCGGGLIVIDSVSTIDNCMFLENSSSRGGGVHSENSNITISDCVFLNNFASQGGGLSVEGGSCTISQSQFLENLSYGWGGGFFAGGESQINVLDCDFLQNSGESGGGFFMSMANGSFSQCLIEGNFATDEGGGGLFEQFSNFEVSGLQVLGNIANDGGGLGVTHFSDLNIVDSTISGNTANHDGGGIYNFETFSTFARLRVTDNSAAHQGGGLFLRILGDPRVENCLILNNHATDSGGGVACVEGVSALFLHCTIDSNSTYGKGGGIRAELLANPTIVNSIIWRNDATREAGLSEGPLADFNLIHVLMQGADPEEPLVFQKDAELDDFGYPGECSAAIDEGTDDYPGLPFTDIDGVLRPQGLRRDLGAHEALGYGHCFLRGDCNGNLSLDISDALTVLGYLFNSEDTDGCVDACDFQDDGFVTITDAIQIISLLFQDGPSPAAPYPLPGPDVNLNNSQPDSCWILGD